MKRVVIFAALFLAGCQGPVVVRTRAEVVKVPVAVPCPDPKDVVARPAKRAGPLPDDARQAAAVLADHAKRQDTWGDAVERQIAACSSVRSAGALPASPSP